MKRFYFHQRSADGALLLDKEGSEHPDLDAAREEARSAMREIVSDRLLSNRSIDDSSFEIADEAGVVVERIRFRDLVC